MDLAQFQTQLRVDPSVALQTPVLNPQSAAGPSHRLQFIVEFVGPRTTPASLANALFDPKWYAALGKPERWTMSAADNQWQPMVQTMSGSYDSIAISWDLLSPKGEITAEAAAHLFSAAEKLSTHFNRRAIPLPHPKDVSAAVAELKSIRDNFDAGFSVVVLPRRGPVAESKLWILCSRLGLTFGSRSGTFDWIVPGTDQLLFSVSPLGGDESFSLGNVTGQIERDGLLLGFNIPTSPAPEAAMEGLLKAALYFGSELDAEIFDDQDRRLTDQVQRESKQALTQVIAAMKKAGIAPGSKEALKLFA